MLAIGLALLVLGMRSTLREAVRARAKGDVPSGNS